MHDIKMEIAEDSLIVMGVAISIDQIKTVLGIILLSVQILLIIYKGVKIVYHKIKNKDYKGVIDTVEETTKKIEEEINKNGKQ